MFQPSDPRSQKQRASIIDRLRPVAAGAGLAGAIAAGSPATAQPPAPQPAPAAAPGAPQPPPGANPAVAGLVGGLSSKLQPPPGNTNTAASIAAGKGPPPDDSEGSGAGGDASPQDEQALIEKTAPGTRRRMAARIERDGEHVGA